MEIEVEWDISPKSGLTEIDLSELGCKNISQWHNLSEDEQKSRLAEAIKEHDLSTVKFIPKVWD